MDNFDYKLYLKNNPLLKENQEDRITIKDLNNIVTQLGRTIAVTLPEYRGILKRGIPLEIQKSNKHLYLEEMFKFLNKNEINNLYKNLSGLFFKYKNQANNEWGNKDINKDLDGTLK